MKLPAHKKALSAAAAVSAMLFTAACGGSDTDPASSPDSVSSSADGGDANDSGTSDAGAEYADGDYEGEGSYSNPGGTSSVLVNLSLTDGKVSGLEVTPEASGTSLQFQNKFISGINDEVVGKSLDELDVSKVAGSSLTSQGFNEAIEQIKADARA